MPCARNARSIRAAQCFPNQLKGQQMPFIDQATLTNYYQAFLLENQEFAGLDC